MRENHRCPLKTGRCDVPCSSHHLILGPWVLAGGLLTVLGIKILLFDLPRAFLEVGVRSSRGTA